MLNPCFCNHKLQFIKGWTRFAETNEIMEKTEMDYSAFEKLMHEERIYLDREIGFSGICALIGADPTALDSHIKRELGHSGQSIVDLYRSQDG